MYGVPYKKCLADERYLTAGLRERGVRNHRKQNVPANIKHNTIQLLHATRALSTAMDESEARLMARRCHCIGVISVTCLNLDIQNLDSHNDPNPNPVLTVQILTVQILSGYRLHRWRGSATSRALDFVISRSRVQILLEATLRNNRGQVVYTYVPLSPSSITWYRPKGGDALRLGR